MIVKSGTELKWDDVRIAAGRIAKIGDDAGFTPPEAVDVHQARIGRVCRELGVIVDALKIIPPRGPTWPIYMAHPVGDDVVNNVARAIRWLRWLMDVEPERTIVAPWLAYVEVFNQREDARSTDAGHPFRERAMRDNLAAVRASQGVVLVGGRISNGMRAEAEESLSTSGWITDLSHLGAEPPGDWYERTIRPLDVAPKLRRGDAMPWEVR